MNMTRVLAVLALTGAAGCGGGDRLSGSGSTCIKPLMDRWIDAYQRQRGVAVNYQGAGSSAGVRQMTDGAVDFACTDVFLTPEQRRRAAGRGGAVVHIPLALSAIVPAYRLDGVERPVRFTGEVLADIFLGRVRRWNDPALQRLNEGVPLPDRDIAVVHRTDGSGSTFLFTRYLQTVSPAWRESGLGAGPTVRWKVGLGEQGNPGVAGFLARTDGSLGYLELYYALLRADEIRFGAVRNRAGAFVRADLRGVTAAAENALKEGDRLGDDLGLDLLDVPGQESYPVSGATWAVLYADQEPAAGRALFDFFTWAVHEGQDHAEGMHYARLPGPLVRRIEARLEKIKR